MSGKVYEDNFSRQAEDYARYRPRYSAELFSFLADLAPGHELVWDCGTGSGQAAVSLAAYFDKVIATDASAQQIANATPHPQVTYRVALAEQSGLADHSADLVAVAQALHWFDLDRFYTEAKRVLKPGGVIAAWTYLDFEFDPLLDRILGKFSQETLRPYWPTGWLWVHEKYETLPFPFTQIEAPQFYLEARWNLDDLIGFLVSWSGRHRFMDAHGYDPIDDIRAELAAAWGPAEEVRTVRWPLYMRVGRV